MSDGIEYVGDIYLYMKLIVLNKKIKQKENYMKYSTMVDDEDYGWLNQWNWSANIARRTIYVERYPRNDSGKSHYVGMHRLILGVTDPTIFVDHKDGNGLNNQRNNLRLCNRSQNAANKITRNGLTSKYMGVARRYNNRWHAHIMKDLKNYFIGSFDTEIEAAMAYDMKAIELHGEFANLNFPNILH